MHKKIVLIFIFTLVSIFISSTLVSSHKKRNTSHQLQNFSNEVLADYSKLNKMIENTNFKIHKKQLLVSVKTSKLFDDLSEQEQFGYFYYYTKHLRFYTRFQLDNKDYKDCDITLTSKVNGQDYKFVNAPDRKSILSTESFLYINEKQTFNSKEFKIAIERYLHNNPEFVNSDIEIIRYAVDLYNKLSVGGKYYNHKKDSKVIVDLVTDKFDITKQEYVDVYKKYFFLLE